MESIFRHTLQGCFLAKQRKLSTPTTAWLGRGRRPGTSSFNESVPRREHQTGKDPGCSHAREAAQTDCSELSECRKSAIFYPPALEDCCPAKPAQSHPLGNVGDVNSPEAKCEGIDFELLTTRFPACAGTFGFVNLKTRESSGSERWKSRGNCLARLQRDPITAECSYRMGRCV
mmetsp:Transcript_47990/g.79124  ORF Transcript_47990/g.79124 Transcript_47990/m.79124 type:complete len:174 (-) Transcript_47990:328-849(-)